MINCGKKSDNYTVSYLNYHENCVFLPQFKNQLLIAQKSSSGQTQAHKHRKRTLVINRAKGSLADVIFALSETKESPKSEYLGYYKDEDEIH